MKLPFSSSPKPTQANDSLSLNPSTTDQKEKWSYWGLGTKVAATVGTGLGLLVVAKTMPSLFPAVSSWLSSTLIPNPEDQNGVTLFEGKDDVVAVNPISSAEEVKSGGSKSGNTGGLNGDSLNFANFENKPLSDLKDHVAYCTSSDWLNGE